MISHLFLVLTVPVAVFGLVAYRDGFRRAGRSSLRSMGPIMLAWLLVHCAIGFSVPMKLIPETPREYLGAAVKIPALLLAILATIPFRTWGMVFGSGTTKLVTSGFHRFSRNSQYVFYGLFLLGYALPGRSIPCYIAVALFWLMLHFMVLAEEEHLERHFGEDYRQYKRRTPRYVLV
jgi:protein-S-isoprenylcysteine O-methyltransferase Ste14